MRVPRLAVFIISKYDSTIFPYPITPIRQWPDNTPKQAFSIKKKRIAQPIDFLYQGEIE
jgi:hypothetical protein